MTAPFQGIDAGDKARAVFYALVHDHGVQRTTAAAAIGVDRRTGTRYLTAGPKGLDRTRAAYLRAKRDGDLDRLVAQVGPIEADARPSTPKATAASAPAPAPAPAPPPPSTPQGANGRRSRFRDEADDNSRGDALADVAEMFAERPRLPAYPATVEQAAARAAYHLATGAAPLLVDALVMANVPRAEALQWIDAPDPAIQHQLDVAAAFLRSRLLAAVTDGDPLWPGKLAAVERLWPDLLSPRRPITPREQGPVDEDQAIAIVEAQFGSGDA